MNNANVSNINLPLLNTIRVSYFEGKAHSDILWNSEKVLAYNYIKEGVYKNICFNIVDSTGKLVKLKTGLFFLHIELWKTKNWIWFSLQILQLNNFRIIQVRILLYLYPI